MRGIVKWGIIVFLVWWVIQDPTGAAHAMHKVGHLGTQAATSVSTVLSSFGG